MKETDLSHVTGADPAYIESLYESYKESGNTIDDSWRHFFEGFEFRRGAAGEVDAETLRREINAFRMIQSYRSRGHLLSDTNPIRPRLDRDARIGVEHHGLEEADLDRRFSCSRFAGLPAGATLREIVERMERVYCHKTGVEYAHTMDTDMRRWIRTRFEETAENVDYPLERKKRILRKLGEAAVFESFLQSKYTGQKRFSLEGAEVAIPALDAIMEKGAREGAREFVIGMSHRGRLNVLANIIGKTYEYIFSEFEGGSLEEQEGLGSGDVKYHLGFSSVKKFAGKDIFLKILPNPSHLESVTPVTQGYARAQLDVVHGGDTTKIVPIILHGDAALAGQGVVYETLQMSGLPAYAAGGAIHFVINNQIGFTTDFQEGRSAHYCTSIAKMLDGPILHVNGDEPESVVRACELAVEFRQRFKRDVWIDMVCYRKHGHNEGDEPKYTQPHLYGLVAKHKSPREIYIEKLLRADPKIKDLAQEVQKEYRAMLADRLDNVKQKELPKRKKGPHKGWANLRWSKPSDFASSPETSVGKGNLKRIVEALVTLPEGFRPLDKARRLLDRRRKAFEGDAIDWGLGELLAYGSILLDGRNVRLTGQDVVRGTFSHRHAKVFDERTNKAHCGLAGLGPGQGRVSIHNSHLSEYAALGYEYGYSQGNPWSLNVWEAQFGDFANGAQVVIDQFIASGESKWRRMCNVVMLLPHGYEGAGPEHSSGRLERFLQLCAEDNMIVANCTTPAQFFHVLRRQMAFPFRKPLIVFTPKSLLRDPRCVSSAGELAKGRFREVIAPGKADPKRTRSLLLCSGKIYYQLEEARAKAGRDDVAVARIEQLHPLDPKALKRAVGRFAKAGLLWVQEEPANMGAWSHVRETLSVLGDVRLVARPRAASPATGYAAVHRREQEELVRRALGNA